MKKRTLYQWIMLTLAIIALSAPLATAAPNPPHYFGPYPNYANSPLPSVTGAVITVGNPLIQRAYATDFATPPGQLGPVLVVVPTALPTGQLQAFQIFNQTAPGASPTASAGNLFHSYVLRPTGTPNQYTVVYDSGELSVPVSANPAGQVETFPVPNIAVQTGDVIAFYGEGIPVDTGTGSDILSYPAPAAPTQASTITLGDASFPIYAQSRTYSFAASVLDLSGNNTAISGGIRKFVDTLPGLTPTGANNLGQYIPVAVPDTTTYPGTDYYEIAVVQYRMKMHTDLPATLLRGYVQLSTNVVPGASVPLSNANLVGADTPITGYTGVDTPHYLGPTIVATKDRPVRILFRNLLPTGVAGDLFLPVDTTIMGSGMGPLASQTPPVDQGLVTDEVRNPMCGYGFMGNMPEFCFTQNRATLHLHGGLTPWISDGTPHQWITPANENTAYPKGVSVSNVPDMPDPGPGAQTFFYTNQQSARLMFYHDHAWGITRLNVFAGEAAGYLLTDPTETALIAPGGPLDGLGYGIPLVIQDRTFVPGAAQLATEDPTWDTARWGGEGSLWVPHVMMPAQNPGDPSGSNAYGRWFYGPWFWPPATPKYGPIANPYFDANCDPNIVLPDGSYQFCEPSLIPGVPNVSVGMEAFNDTPVVNGTAYPTTTLEPKTYRLRILNAANDRFWNLQWYVANATGTEVALKAAEVAAAQLDPVVFPTPDTTLSPAGPDWIQIGTEGGFLPAPAVISGHQPTTWITNPTRFDVGNVDLHSLLLAPAERADVIVDFSQFAGKTLILYNDAPAAFPARIAGYDYYTGAPDMTGAGGVPPILPGYGPNTRTIMQVKIAASAPAPAFNLAALQAAFSHHLDANGKPAGVFESSQDPIIVGQFEYNSAYGANFTRTGWCNSPVNPSAKCDGLARINEQGGTNFLFKFDTLLGTQLALPFQPKGLHDETNAAVFDEYGRMMANLGLEAPGATPLTQNIILYPYINPPTEFITGIELPEGSLQVSPIASAADRTQIWKITHNGVDTHPIHFHLFNVQLLNRVTWDNIIIKPDANELGWKDTVRVSPLEDTIVALRPIIPKQPFGVPDSIRPLNPMMPLGDTSGFNNTDTLGNPITPGISNVIANFGWEYVWHCHILGHEEMDMMRPVNVFVSRALASAPVLTASGIPGSPISLSWTDGTPANYLDPATWGNPANEIGFRIERATGAGAFAQIGAALANITASADATTVAGTTYRYRVTAYNAAGDSISNTVTVTPPPVITTVALPNGTVGVSYTQTLAVTGGSTPLTWSVSAGTLPTPLTLDAATGVISGTPNATGTYNFTVMVTDAIARTATQALSITVTVPPMLLVAPTDLSAQRVATNQVRLTWTDLSTGETNYQIQRATNNAGTNWATVTTGISPAGALTSAGTGGFMSVTLTATLNNGTNYRYRVAAMNGATVGPFSNVASVNLNAAPAAPSGLTGSAVVLNTLQDRVTLNWTDNSNNESNFQIQSAQIGGNSTTCPAANSITWNNLGSVGINVTTFNQNVSRSFNFCYRVRATNNAGNSAWTPGQLVITP